MAAVRIAAVLLAVILSLSGTQLSSQTQVTIQVTDTARSFIPDARITIDPSLSSMDPYLKTNGEGEAKMALPARTYTLTVAANGFEGWTGKIDVQSGSDQVIAVTLVASPIVFCRSGGPCLTIVRLRLSPEATQPIFLSLQTVSNLAPLPSHRTRERW